MAQSTNHQPRSLTHDDASAAWEDAYAYKAQIARNEAERAKPVPCLTMAVLLWLSAFLFGAVLIFSHGPEVM